METSQQKILYVGFLKRAIVVFHKEMNKNEAFVEYILCLILGIIVRVLYCWKYPVPVRDAYIYSNIIENWIKQGSISAGKGNPPLGLFLLKIPATYLGCDIIKGGIIINMILGLAIILIMGIIIYEIYPSTKIRLLVMVIVATHPSMVQFSCQMLRENSYLFFTCLAMYFGIRFIKSNHVLFIFPIGFFCTVAYLCRHEAIENIAIISLIILLYRKKRLIERLNCLLLLYVSLGLSFIAVSKLLRVPWSYYYYIKEAPFFD